MNHLLVFYRRMISFLPYGIGIVFGVLTTFYPTLISRFSRLQPDPGDTRFVNYVLEHSFQLLVNKDYVGELWSPPFFFPLKNALAFSENMFGSAPIYWLFRALFDSVLAFQWWMIVVLILCFVCFALLMQHYKVNSWLSAFGAFLFTFGMPRVSQLGHQQLLPQFFTPLAFWFCWDFIRQPTNKRLILTLLFIYFQLLASVYLGWFLLFSLTFVFSVAWFLDKNIKQNLFEYLRKNYKVFIAAVLAWSILIVGLFAPYLETKRLIGGRPYSEVADILPKFTSWLRPAPGSLWWPLLSSQPENFLPWPVEHHLFLGFAVVLLTGFSLYVLWRKKEVLTFERELLIKTCLVVVAILFILSLKIGNFSLWRTIYEIVPGGSAIRAVTRISLVLYFYLLIAVIVCFDSYIKKASQSRRLRVLLAGVVCLLGLSEQITLSLMSYEKAPFTQVELEMQEVMKKGCDVAYVSATTADPSFWSQQMFAMAAGIRANVPVINGYSGWTPPGYDGSMANEPRKNLDQVAKLLPKNFKGQLCVILPTDYTEVKSVIAPHGKIQYRSFAGNFTSYSAQLPFQIFAQAIEVLNPPNSLKLGSVMTLPVRVKNTSNFLWSARGLKPVRFAYHWIERDGKVAVWDGERTELPLEVSPQESILLNAKIKAPDVPGKYILRLTMVQEGVAWFDDKGAETEDLAVNVAAQ
ncbi:hypothetical protein [Trichocoleus sp. FACHB-591]|uniref:hypothetical protein n=1 Tax=Trichocoleus sp. FACHB-591 TaxID=2692872 RepID=UPI0016832276|nr:hypothetical protein [Trichocoleus sp. FACHB-591]